MSRAEGSLLLVVFAAASGCGPNDWRTDMWYQPSLRPQTAPRPEPEDSVPVQGKIVAEEREDLEDLENPVPRDPASIARGKRLFETRCTACHGADGHGNGPICAKFPPAPDVCFESIRRRSDGFLFATLTLGGRAMPTQREGLNVRDRWDLVNYVRWLQATTPVADGGVP
ncbi:MAG: c-type cytochrome [Myxococcales bacterium]